MSIIEHHIADTEQANPYAQTQNASASRQGLATRTSIVTGDGVVGHWSLSPARCTMVGKIRRSEKVADNHHSVE